MDSILNTIKKSLGIDASYTAFDTDIIMDINGSLPTLTQLGVGPKEGFTITGPNETWSQLTNDNALLNIVQPALYLMVKMLFDPPANSFVVNSFEKQLEEMKWRITVMTYPITSSNEGNRNDQED